MALLLVSAVPDPLVLAIAAGAAVLPVPLYTFLVLQLDRYEHEPWQVLVAAFLWGALVATFVAAIFNSLIGEILTALVGEALGEVLSTSAVAPIVEETAKGFALLLLYWVLRHEFDNVLDGIVYGSLVGIGFAMTENILYFGRMYQSEGLAGLGVLFYLRVMLGGFGIAAQLLQGDPQVLPGQGQVAAQPHGLLVSGNGFFSAPLLFQAVAQVEVHLGQRGL